MQTGRQWCLGVGNQGGPKAPPGPATPSGTSRGAILWYSRAELTQAAAGLRGSRQLASPGQGKQQVHLPTRVQQEALSMHSTFHAVEIRVAFSLKNM